MAEPGTWEGPDDRAMLDALPSFVPLDKAGELFEALDRAGLLVRMRYYVPSIGELYDMYGAVTRELWRGMRGHVRWVMCRETHDALGRRHLGQRASVPPDVRRLWSMSGGYVEPETVTVVDIDYRDATARLFGVPVRIDPAARSPLIEIDTEATIRRSLTTEER